jgi:hypothetical protein
MRGVSAIEEAHMRIYISTEALKKLEKCAERRDTSPESQLERLVCDRDEEDARDDARSEPDKSRDA